MAYAPKITADVPCLRTFLNIYDATGAYDADDNPGGLGTPNPEIADISAATVTITVPAADYTATGESTVINVYPTIPNLTPLVYYSVAPEDIGQTDKISDGWYAMQLSETYDIGAGDVTVTYDYNFLSTEQMECAVNRALTGQCKCGCDNDEEILEVSGMIQTAHALFTCEMYYKASALLEQIARKIRNWECNC